mmetsp:Transcript_65241/g.155853  ORF Transcript_65241/g.155853 Transcript_65241/m.155853 type:complete len:517 (+) Transcript_65241:101-1651(+)
MMRAEEQTLAEAAEDGMADYAAAPVDDADESPQEILLEPEEEDESETAGLTGVAAQFAGTSASSDARLPLVSASAHNGRMEDRSNECWICKDTTDEPLIRPCACKGSMTGVHASCLQEWIRHYRQSAENLAHPRCSVCHQPYLGTEVRPGAGRFVKELVGLGAYLLLRWAPQLLVLHLYVVEATRYRSSDPEQSSSLARTLVAVATAISLLLYKVIVVTVSLPNGQPQRLLSLERMLGSPPRSRLLMRCYASSWGLRLHLAELSLLLMVLGLGLLVGNMPAFAVAPAFLVMGLPLAKVFVGNTTEARRRAAACLCYSLAACATSPYRVGKSLLSTIHEAAHPLDAGPQIVLPIVTVVLTLAGPYTAGLQRYYGLHTSAAIVGIVEQNAVRRLSWRSGRAWFLAMQVVWLSWSLTNSRYMGVNARREQIHILLASTAWAFSMVVLGARVNWEHCLAWFQEWQTRRGVFLLQTSLLTADPDDVQQADSIAQQDAQGSLLPQADVERGLAEAPDSALPV